MRHLKRGAQTCADCAGNLHNTPLDRRLTIPPAEYFQINTMNSDTTSLKQYTTTSSSISIGTSTRASTESSLRRRRQSFHVTSFAFSVVCKLLAVYQSPPPMQIRPSRPASAAPSAAPSLAPSARSSKDERPPLLPISVFGDISGPHLCKIVLVLKELGLPYVLKVLDLSNIKDDPYAPSDLNRGVPAIEDPNTNLTLWEVSW